MMLEIRSIISGGLIIMALIYSDNPNVLLQICASLLALIYQSMGNKK